MKSGFLLLGGIIPYRKVNGTVRNFDPYLQIVASELKSMAQGTTDEKLCFVCILAHA